MSKSPVANLSDEKEKAFEMIELAIDQSELLSRAFDIIGQVCCEQLSMAIEENANSGSDLLQ